MSSFTSSSNGDVQAAAFSPPWGLILTVAIVLAVEITVFARCSTEAPWDPQRQLAFYPLDRLPTFEESIVQWQIDFCRRKGQPQDVLLLGDSSCLMGLRPRRIVQRTGLKAWDVGTLSWLQIEGHQELLEMYVEHQGPPRLVVYHVSTLLLGFNSPGEYLARLRTYLQPQSQPPPWLPSLAYRRTIRNGPMFQWMEDDLLTAPRGVFPSDAEVRRILLQRRGAMSERRQHTWSEAPNVQVALPPYAAASLRKLFRFCAQHECRVLLMINPLPEIARTPQNAASLDRLAADLRRLADEFPQVELFDPLIRFYPNELCFSVEHVYEDGARRNTDELIERIRRVQ